jgi:hypothetical protein
MGKYINNIWSESEKKKLLTLNDSFPYKWSIISKKIKGRSPKAVRYKYIKLKKKNEPFDICHSLDCKCGCSSRIKKLISKKYNPKYEFTLEDYNQDKD